MQEREERTAGGPVPAGPSERPLRPTILIVDDEPRLARLLSLTLDQYEIRSAIGGRQALELLLGDEHFDVVLCDLNMPGIDGVDVFEEVARARPELLGRFVIMSGGAYSARTEQFLARTPTPILEKPFTPEGLETAVRTAIRGRGPAAA